MNRRRVGGRRNLPLLNRRRASAPSWGRSRRSCLVGPNAMASISRTNWRAPAWGPVTIGRGPRPQPSSHPRTDGAG